MHSTRYGLLACAAVIGLAVAAFGAPIEIYVSLVTGAKDGDTIMFHQQEMQLYGIVAPEPDQPGGREAIASLRSLVVGREVRCQPAEGSTLDTDHLIGTCFLGDIDIGGYQVTKGLARDCPRISRGRYAAAEVNARTYGRDLSKTFSLPDSCQAP